ncbi:hypothetical protein CY35_02G139700, partial [Sphagnum magellanicum]
KALFDPNNVEFDCVKTDVHSKHNSLCKFFYPNCCPDELKRVCVRLDSVGLQPGRRGTKAFFSPGGSSQGKMATEQYFKHVRPLQGSLSTMGATKSINTRYADTIRSQLLKRVQK